MDILEFIRTALQRSRQATVKAVDGLTAEELAWRPGPEANHIGLILFHQARSEDNFVQRVRGGPTIWESGKWYEKLGVSEKEAGGGFTAEQVAAFCSPQLKDLLAYGEAVHNSTIEYLNGIKPNKLDEKFQFGRTEDFTVGALFALIVTHGAQHAGEMAYVRGLKRGMNK
ncbi:MAG: DinB family protein [Chloroflexi bacterium]|nr:DinB family protein [Chloroflexota bacterium]